MPSFGEPSKSPKQTLTQNETVFIIKDHTQESKAQSVENGLSIPAKMLHPTTPHPLTHTQTVHLSQPPSLTLTLQQHQDIVLLDGSLHHQRRSRNTAAVRSSKARV